MAVADEARTVRFGLFEVEPRAGELRKNGVKIKLQEQSFRLLVTLLELHIDAGKVKPDRDYEASNHLVSLGSTAKRNSLLLRRREAGGGSC
jgi:hypothetical protein